MVTLTVLATALTALFVTGSNAQVDQQRRFEAQTRARVALDVLRRDLHYACRVDVNPVLGSIGASITLWFTDSAAHTPDPLGACVHSAGNSAYDVKVSWCTSGSGTRWALYRATGATCSSVGSTRYADYLTSGTVFAYVAPTSTARGRLHVDLPVNPYTGRATDAYTLSDDIALLDTQRL
jgi:hypothetical protein